MREQDKGGERDFLDMDDEELVRRARGGGCPAALHALQQRYYGWLRILIARLAAGTELTPADVEDAQQQAVLHLLLAVAAYRVGPGPATSRCRFHTFAEMVLTRRFLNDLRGLRRQERRHERAVRSDDLLAGAVPHTRADGRPWAPPVDEAGDPARIAERNEAVVATRRVLSGCCPLLRRLAEDVAAGASLGTLAADLGRPYESVKWTYRRFVSELRRLLASHRG